MKFIDAVKNYETILTEGGMVERIRRNDSIELDEHIVHAGLIYDPKSKEALKRIYKDYIDIGQKHNLPFITLAPTWRANPERIRKSKFPEKLESLNSDCVEFMEEILSEYGNYATKVFIGGMLACKNDAYKPDEALSKNESYVFHKTQIGQLSETSVDFIKAATLPALSEALGISEALSETAIPYIISFVLRPDGNLLDGNNLAEAITKIDTEIKNPPLFYMANCVHPTIFDSALKINPDLSNRLLGLQANTSAKSPEELEGLAYLDTTEPDQFSKLMIDIKQKYKLKVIGGCCGSDSTHIQCIAEKI